MDQPTVLPEMSPGARAETPAELSPAVQRFNTCRWKQAAEDGIPEHCTHRDVLPIAGTGGFDAEAWCPDCSYFKVRRTPRKKQFEPDRYY